MRAWSPMCVRGGVICSKYASRVGRVELLKDDTVFCVFFPLPSLIMEQWGTPSIQRAKVR